MVVIAPIMLLASFAVLRMRDPLAENATRVTTPITVSMAAAVADQPARTITGDSHVNQFVGQSS
jgi:hypothetical protein